MQHSPAVSVRNQTTNRKRPVRFRRRHSPSTSSSSTTCKYQRLPTNQRFPTTIQSTKDLRIPSLTWQSKHKSQALPTQGLPTKRLQSATRSQSSKACSANRCQISKTMKMMKRWNMWRLSGAAKRAALCFQTCRLARLAQLSIQQKLVQLGAIKRLPKQTKWRTYDSKP